MNYEIERFIVFSDNESSKVHSFMIDVLCALITESDNISSQLLDIILVNILEPQKTSKNNAYHLAKGLIIKTNETLEQYIQQVTTNTSLAGHNIRSQHTNHIIGRISVL